jgi:hypothetical protein
VSVRAAKDLKRLRLVDGFPPVVLLAGLVMIVLAPAPDQDGPSAAKQLRY